MSRKVKLAEVKEFFSNYLKNIKEMATQYNYEDEFEENKIL